ncbi:tyrosinase family protein [Nitrosomonas nitrosa]|uniref:tyrosinase family protein n=1 Tax=Nitrosomonas nitrosa TaxID=52442 RepID=UPI0023F642D9|nr:tyrosinase family protein [Nitrosomonas nitrosa]MCO6434795.1 tyrosinase family protein [Nitrosomonas nitrosa]
MKCRKNVRNLTQAEKNDFVRACKGLKGLPSLLHPGTQSRYDDYVEVHLNAMNSNPNWGHGDRAFLPWHRELLYRFEKDLQSIVPGVRIPYWDWTRHKTTADVGFPFKNEFLGRDGDPADSDRVKRDPAVPLNADGTYPFEFDPDNWTIVVKDFAVDPSFLTRDFGSWADAPDLPVNDPPLPVGVNASFRQAVGSTSYGTLRSRAEDIHNLVHRWVVGAMITASSPNDMVFWLHHAAIDRMWTLWQKKNPALDPYVGSATLGHGLTDTMIFHDPGDPAPWVGTATPQQMIEGHTIHGDGVWYDTDLPEISLDSGPTLAFGDIPEGLTTFRAVRFRIQTCRATRFRITAAPTGNFGLTPLGTEFIAQPDEAANFVNGYVWVQFHAVGAASQSSSVSIQAYIIDDEGYYAVTEGAEFALGSWSVNLTAGVEARANNAVVLVLDRSGSMAAAAGGTSTRSSLLKNAVGVFHTLMLPDDEIGVVSFDDLVETPLPLTTQSAGLGTLLTGTALDPRGLTGIGLGIQTAAPILAGSSHTNRSMLILTDGNENVHPYVNELPAGTISNRTFSIGFGLPGQVSDTVLSAIASNTGGFFSVTGNFSTEEQRFFLTKHFVQVLAGATNANIIIDPQGELGWGDSHIVEFDVAATEVSIDVIALCPLADLLEFVLLTPGGQIVNPASAAVEPNVQFLVKGDVAFYRLLLPALPAAAVGSHAGRWQAHFQLRKLEELKGWLVEHRQAWTTLATLRGRGTLPYNCIVHTYSNLNFDALLIQAAFTPGSEIKLETTLSEYGVPFGRHANVWAEVTRPDGSTDSVLYSESGSGRHKAAYSTSGAGVYQFRVRANGATSSGHPFTREKLLTASIFAGEGAGSGGLDDLIDVIRERDERLCRLLLCLTEQGVLDERIEKALREAGIDINAIRKCIKQWCASNHRDRELSMAKTDGTASLSPHSTDLLDELMRRLALIDPEIFFTTTPPSRPIIRPAPLPKKRMPHSKGEHFPPVKAEDEDEGCKPCPDEHDCGHDQDDSSPHGQGHDEPSGRER